MKERGQGRPEGAPKSQRNAQLKEQGNYRKESAANSPSGALNSIRADQDVDTFVAGLRKNKEQLLSLAQEQMRKPADTRAERGTNLVIGIYLDVVLKEHVFGIDPFASKRLDDEQVQEDRAVVANEIVSWVGSQWSEDHPDSKAAKEVAKLGIFAFPCHHQELLQEMWPVIRYVEILPEKKVV